MTRRKTLIIGLDGATFEVLTPLMEKKRLPNLQRMMENGASGVMRSTIPPLTAPAWLALATGIGPEKTGAYDFVMRCDADYHLRSLDSSFYQDRAIWDHLSKKGRTVAMLNYPLLRPPYPVNGVMVAGIGAVPGEEFTYPSSLKDDFYKTLGEQYEIVLPLGESHYEDTDLLFEDLDRMLDKQAIVAEELLRQKEWDLFWVVFSMTDWVQHFLWRHIDATHPGYQGAKSDAMAGRFEVFWSKVDDILGRLAGIAGPETNVLVVSDHGFGPHNRVFRLNAWLEREGYLTRRKAGVMHRVRRSLSSSLQKVALKASRFKIFPSVFYDIGRRSIAKIRADVSDRIDLDKTIAFDPGHMVPVGGIYINDRVVTDGAEREFLAQEIIGKLKAWGTEHGVLVETWQPGLDAEGEKLSNLPDIIVGADNWACEMIKDSFDGPLVEDRPYLPTVTGNHRLEGVFIGTGPDIHKVSLDAVSIFDFAPTLFYMFDEAVPSSVDGRVLTEIFDPAYVADHPVTLEKGSGGAAGRKSNEYDEGQEDAIRKQLQSLGYM